MKTTSIKVESRTERLIAVRDFVSESARAFGFSDEDISKIALAVDEACTNVIKHAYRSDPTKIIQVNVRAGDGTFQVAILDEGIPFNPMQVQPLDMKDYLTHYRRGGLGVHLMKSLMDKVEYSINPGKTNEVLLIKYLPR